MEKPKIIIEERELNIKLGQAINLLFATYPNKYVIEKTLESGKIKLDLDDKRLLIDTLNIAKKMVINEHKSKILVNKYWNREDTNEEYMIEVLIR